MPTQTEKTSSTIWKVIRAPKLTSLAKYFIQEPTEASFSKRIESIEAVPETYRDFFNSNLTHGAQFPYTILMPPHNGYMVRSAEKLLVNIGSEIHILEKRGTSFDRYCHPISDIDYVENRAVLLDSSIKITGMTSEGQPATSMIHFNSVTEFLFTPVLKKIRGFEAGPNSNALNTERQKFDKWQSSSFKFMNFARNSLLGNERVVQSVLQPEIRTAGIRIFGVIYSKTISPAHAAILTDRELIMIREEVRHAGEDRYGGIWDYIPLHKIVDLSLHEKDEKLLALTILLPHEVSLEFLYQLSAREELEKLLSHFKSMTAEERRASKLQNGTNPVI